VAERLAERLSALFPGLRIVGLHAPPFRTLTEQEESAVVERINASEADIVWVGLSTPKQERWMAAFRSRLTPPVLIGVGAAFDFLSGAKPQAPRWMQRSGLEWLFRLASEPRRLWPRYRRYPLFVALAAAQLLGLRKFPAADGPEPDG
jgi:N-acetylglucosaminyldiphosphoundecaprenol N-acetyl-beta-D-mannosaminyltransferase